MGLDLVKMVKTYVSTLLVQIVTFGPESEPSRAGFGQCLVTLVPKMITFLAIRDMLALFVQKSSFWDGFVINWMPSTCK